MSQFVERLEAQGIEVRANLAATDVSFAFVLRADPRAVDAHRSGLERRRA